MPSRHGHAHHSRRKLTWIPQPTQGLGREPHIRIIHTQHTHLPPSLLPTNNTAPIHIHRTAHIALGHPRKRGAMQRPRWDPLRIHRLGTELDTRSFSRGAGIGQGEAAQRGQRVCGHRGEFERLWIVLRVGRRLWLCLLRDRRPLAFLLHRDVASVEGRREGSR
jgi:hypothetical protein